MTARSCLGWFCAVFVLALCVPAAAHALELPPGGVTLKTLNGAGEPETRAGAHPNRLVMSFAFSDGGDASEDLKDMTIDFTAGLGGDPNAVPLCPRWLFSEQSFSEPGCSPASQVGVLRTGAESLPLYSIEPGPNETAVFGASKIASVKFVVGLRPGDQGLSLRLSDIGQSSLFSVREGQVELWGVPADHQTGTSIPRRPLLTMPTRCDAGPLAVTVSAHTWQQPGRWFSGGASAGQALTDCAGLSFDTSLGVSLSNPVADAPTGASIDLSFPQGDDPDGRASAQVKDLSISLPVGMGLAVAGVSGLSACTDAQLGLGTSVAATCPPSSRVGSIELSVPQLARPLTGSLYLGQQRPGDRFRFFAVAAGMGAEAKLVGSLRPDPASGRLTAVLSDLPQVSFNRMSLRFDGGPRALIATPLTCGPATTTAKATPYNGAVAVDRATTVAVAAAGGAPCAGAAAPFEPQFSAGTTPARAGRNASFSVTVRRRDGEQLPDRLEIALPAGLSAGLGTIDLCPAVAAATGICPAASRIGAAVAELGPGSEPARLQGDVYLTGPYRRAPFGLVLALKAATGSFNLGTVAFRSALRVNPLSGQVTIATDPLPSPTFEGVSGRFQTIGLDIDRPGLMRNPTACSPASVTATLRSAAGAIAHRSSPFAVRNCIGLPFRPAFSIALTERGQLHEGGRPGLTISSRLPSGTANLRLAEFSLPRLVRLDPSGLRAICARREALRGNCPRASRIGSGHARTPLLDGSLKGAVYVVQPSDNGTPDLWASLEGHGLRVDLRGETAVKDGRLETRLVDLPDLPLTSLEMRLIGGRRGVLELRKGPCGTLVAPLKLVGQNGARLTDSARLAALEKCGGSG